MCESARRPLTHDQVRFDPRAVQHLQNADAEDGSSRAGNADDESRGLCLFHVRPFSPKYEACRKHLD